MGPVRGETNDPTTVTQSVPVIAEIKGVTEEEAKQTIRNNFKALFSL